MESLKRTDAILNAQPDPQIAVMKNKIDCLNETVEELKNEIFAIKAAISGPYFTENVSFIFDSGL